MSAEAPRSGPPTPRSSAIGTSRGSPMTARRIDGSIRPGSLPVEGIDFGPFPCTSLRRAGQAEHRTREIRRMDFETLKVSQEAAVLFVAIAAPPMNLSVLSFQKMP